MDQWLAQVYGTNGADDLEKTAQVMMLQKLAEEEGVDLSALSPEEVEALAAEVAGEEGGEVAPQEDPALEEAAQQELLAKEAEAKFQEADFLGRVMAHAYTQELEKIANSALEGDGPVHTLENGPGAKQGIHRFGREAARRGKNFAHGVADVATGKQFRGGLAKHKAMKSGLTKAVSHGNEELAARFLHGKGLARKAMMHGGAKTLGLYGGAAAAGGLAHHFMKEKKASAFDKLAEMRAAEILQANGIDPSTGAPAGQEGPEGQAPSQEEQFGQALDGRALEMLSEAGYDVSGLVGDQQ